MLTSNLAEEAVIDAGALHADNRLPPTAQDNQGKEISIAKADIEESAKSNNSLMPDNLADQLKPDEIDRLLAYLLAQRAKPPVTVSDTADARVPTP